MSDAVGRGIFSWGSDERRSNRYGAFYLDASDFGETAIVSPRMADLGAFCGKRVRITCRVEESRMSGHMGDRALGVYPVRPENGEMIELGVGTLGLEKEDFSPLPCLVLKPQDGRRELWIDPRVLYRLHDQTVAIFIEETSDPYSPAPRLEPVEGGVISNGDGSFQVKHVGEGPLTLLPKIESLGGGRFSVSHDFSAGERIETRELKAGAPR